MAVTACEPGPQPLLGGELPAQETANEVDVRVQEAVRPHFDEFSAPDPVVTTVLTAEAAGVIRNGLLIATPLVPVASHAAVGLGWAVVPCYLWAGGIMLAVGAMLLPSCYADFEKAMQGNSTEEKWRSALNLLDKCLLIAIGTTFCAIGAFTLASLIAATQVAVVALAGAALFVASILVAVLFTLRGLEMMARGGYGLWKANQFQQEFQDHCAKGDVVTWLQGEKERDPLALKNRIGQKAFDALANEQNNEVLIKSLDRGICEEKLKQQLFLSIGSVMFIGGALSLVAIGLSHGAAAPVVATALGISGSAFSLSMEALWMPYDNPKWFRQLADWRYQKHEQERLPPPLA